MLVFRADNQLYRPAQGDGVLEKRIGVVQRAVLRRKKQYLRVREHGRKVVLFGPHTTAPHDALTASPGKSVLDIEVIRIEFIESNVPDRSLGVIVISLNLQGRGLRKGVVPTRKQIATGNRLIGGLDLVFRTGVEVTLERHQIPRGHPIETKSTLGFLPRVPCIRA